MYVALNKYPGPEFEDKVRELGVGLDQQQLHNLVSDVMRYLYFIYLI